MGTQEVSKTAEDGLVTCRRPFAMELEPRQSVRKFAFREPAPATARCGGKREDLGRLGVSKDVIEKEGSYAFLRQFVIKLKSLKLKVLCGS